MSEPEAQPGLPSPFTGQYGDKPKPGSRLAVWSVVLGSLGPCTVGITSLPGVIVSLLAIRRGGFTKLGVTGLILCLMSTAVCWPLFTGPWLVSVVSPRYKVSYELKRVGLPALPSGVTDYAYEASHGLFTGDLYVTFRCNASDAKAWLDAVPDARVHRTSGWIPPEDEDQHPTSFRPDQAPQGWYISEWVWGPEDDPRGYGLEILYDEQTQTMYIYWYWS